MLLGNGQFLGCSVRAEHARRVASGGNVIPIKPSMCPVCLYFVRIPVCCIRIIVHTMLISSLVIDMSTFLLGLKNEQIT